MRNFIAGSLALALIASSATAADNSGPLAPGKPAGVHNADLHGNALFIVLGAAAIVAIAIAASSGSSSSPVSGGGGGSTTTTTTTTTGTTA